MIWSQSFERHEVLIDYLPVFGLAIKQAAIEIVQSATINPPPEGSSPLQITSDMPGAPVLWPRILPLGATEDFGRDMQEFLECLAEPMVSRLTISLGDNLVGTAPLTVLPPRMWPHHPGARTALATHVTPGDHYLLELASSDGKGSERRTQSLHGDDPSTAAAIWYERIRTAELCYEPPRVERDGDTGLTYQEIRTPEFMLATGRSRSVNCLDLSLLFAGLLESAGFAPLIILTGTIRSAPEHAFVGAWKTPGARFRPLVEDVGVLCRELEAGGLWVLEATGVCTGRAALDFRSAERSARHRLEGGGTCHAIDVGALRPPIGRVRPLIAGLSPAVHRVIQIARQMGDQRRVERRESLHLLYGLCRADGDAIQDVLGQAGDTGAGTVARLIEASTVVGSGVDAPRMTRNYQASLAAARWHADQRRPGAPIEEIDMVRALLEAPSANTRRILEVAGYDPATMPDRMRRLHGDQREMTASRAVIPRRPDGVPMTESGHD